MGRSWGGGRPERFPDPRAGERASALTPGARLLRATVSYAAPTPVPTGSQAGGAICSGPEPCRAPGALSPAGRRSLADVRPAPSKSSSTFAFTPARKVTRPRKADSK